MSARIHSPHELRDKLVAYYERVFKRVYGAADRTAIERKVVADLQYVDAAKRAAHPRRARKRAEPVERASVLERVRDPELKGLALKKTEAPEGDAYTSPLYVNPQLVGERWAAAVARVARILRGTGGSNLYTQAVASAGVPTLALKILETYGFYMNRGTVAPIRGVDHNPYRGLTNRDAFRAFARRIEDICDESNAYFPAWWVK